MTDDASREVQADDSRTPAREADLDVAARAPGTVAAAVSPDDTPEVRTRVDRDPERDLPPWAGGLVRVHVERPTTGGLQATVDDAVVNLTVAERVVAAAREPSVDEQDESSTAISETNTDANATTDADADNDTNT